MIHRALLVLLVLLAALSSAPVADAQPKPPAPVEAATLKAEGDAAMDALRFEDALRAYERSYAAKPDPAILFNQGRALEALGRLPEALDKLNEFDQKATPELRAKVGDLLKKHLQEIHGRVATLVVDGLQDGATLRLGDRVLGVAPLKSLRVNAGKVHLEASLEGFFPETLDTELAGGKENKVTLTLTPRDPRGTLTITSNVVGARVYVDAQPTGQVPVEVKLQPGPHLIRVEQDGYDASESRIELKTGEKRTFDVPIAKRPIEKEWWFWTTLTAGVLLTGGAVGLGVALTTEEPHDIGNMSPEVITVEGVSLFRF
jgi:hypothetical protein